MPDLAKPTVITLYQEQLDLLDAVGKEHGISGRSAVARYIFTDWPKLKRAAIAAAAPAAQPVSTTHPEAAS